MVCWRFRLPYTDSQVRHDDFYFDCTLDSCMHVKIPASQPRLRRLSMTSCPFSLLAYVTHLCLPPLPPWSLIRLLIIIIIIIIIICSWGLPGVMVTPTISYVIFSRSLGILDTEGKIIIIIIIIVIMVPEINISTGIDNWNLLLQTRVQCFAENASD